jgi:predicted phage terminase large subunit-like protein
MESMRLFVTSWLSWDDAQRSRALEVIRSWPRAWQDHATREIRRLTAVEAYPTPGDLAAALDPTVVNTPALRLIDSALVEFDTPDGRKRRIITMAPQEGKSERCSKWFVLWWLLRHPDARIVIASYAHGLARRWGKAVRDLIDAHPELGLRVRGDASAAAEWQLAGHRGGVVTVGVGSGLTGRPADVMVVDDPLAGQKEADSATYREGAQEWLRTTVLMRLAPGAPMLVVQTRWHEADPAGWLLSEFPGVWTVLNIPALADHDPAAGEVDPLDREPGEWLESSRGRTVEGWELRRLEAGSRGFQALLQGRPSAPEGAVFKREWWVRTPVRPVQLGDGTWTGLCDVEIVSVDAAFKDTDGSDFVSIQVWGKRGARARLLDRVYARMDFVETVASLRRVCAKWPNARLKLIEEKANGAAVISYLRHEIPGMVAVNPVDSKLSRAYGVTPFCEAGNVEIWDAPWAQDWVEQMAAFPTGAHDDDVDATTQALDRLLGSAGGGLQGFMNQLQAERGERSEPSSATAMRARFPGSLPPARTGV